MDESIFSSTESKYVRAVGMNKLGRNSESLNLVNDLLREEPNNQQFKELKILCESQISSGNFDDPKFVDGVIGMALVGGIAIGVLGFTISLLRTKK